MNFWSRRLRLEIEAVTQVERFVTLEESWPQEA